MARNQALGIWVKKQLAGQNEKFVFISDKRNEMKISRYGASRDDFGFFVKPGCNTTINSVYTIERCELNAVDGDCKELAKEYDKYQLIANMNKCAADIAYQSVLAGFLFEKISVYTEYDTKFCVVTGSHHTGCVESLCTGLVTGSLHTVI